MKDDVTFSYGEGRLTAHIKCDIDHHTARRMRERIDQALFEKRPEVLILDFSSVEFMDSSGLGLVLGTKIFVTQNFSDIFASSNTCRFDAQGHISRQP